ncbi:MAG: glycine cleavage system protein GcvH [Sedimentisphaerales bacterium]|nr:glycine cleavage system protein GcvH [Sedimentisphaerales bacterium]
MIPKDCRFLESHEWARLEKDGTIAVGISDHAIEHLGDLVYLELPAGGKKVKKGDSFGSVESVKAASDIYAPVGGEIIAVNEELADDLERFKTDNYEGCWLVKIKPADKADFESLMTADAYEKLLETEE